MSLFEFLVQMFEKSEAGPSPILAWRYFKSLIQFKGIWAKHKSEQESVQTSEKSSKPAVPIPHHSLQHLSLRN